MLEYIRNHVGGFLGLFLVAALSFVFALSFGQQSEGWGKESLADNTAITVDKAKISVATLNYAINMYSNRDLSSDSQEYQSLKQQVAKGLIERQLLLNMAQTAGISASTEEAEENIIKGEFFITRPIDQILSQLSFQIQMGNVTGDQISAILVKEGHRAMLGRFTDAAGKFDKKTFDNVIRYRLSMREESFIEEQRLELIAMRMRALLISGITVPESEIKDEYNRSFDTVTLSYIRVSPSQFESIINAEEEIISKWANENKEEINKYYENNKYKYTNLEKSAHAKHILLKPEDAQNEDAIAAARATANGLLAKIKAGENFEELAKEYSADTQSAVKGGDLGFNTKGTMVSKFDEVLFSMTPGTVSDLVETEYGFHIIKLVAFREGDISLEEATHEIARSLYLQKTAHEKAKDLAHDLQTALNAGIGIDYILEETDAETATQEAIATRISIPEGLTLRVASTSPFSKTDSSIPGIGRSAQLIQQAFLLNEEKPIADDFFEINDTFYVISLKERLLPSEEDFKKNKEDIQNRLLATRMSTWMSDKMTTLLHGALKNRRINSIIPIQSQLMEKEDLPAAATSKEG